jgi:hypothetical protein
VICNCGATGYKCHRAVAPLLAPFDLGSPEEDAVHMLLIDRERNVASVAPVDEARTFLAGQHPPAPELTPEQQEAFNRELERMARGVADEVGRSRGDREGDGGTAGASQSHDGLGLVEHVPGAGTGADAVSI